MASTPQTVSRGGWYHGWNIIAVAVLSQMAVNGLALNSMSLFLKDWAHDLRSPISQILLAMLPLSTVCGITAPITGALADKYSARWLFAGGLTGMTAFSLLMSMVTATWQIWILYGCVFPVSLSLATSITSNAVVSRWFVRRIGLALGITAFGFGMSGMLLPPLISHVMPVIGWRAVWRIAGLVTGLVVLPLVLWVVRDRPSEQDGTFYLSTDGAASAARGHAHSHSQGGGGLGWGHILKRRNYWLLVICFLPIAATYGGVQQNLAPILVNHGFNPTASGWLLLIFSGSGVIGNLVMGLASDRFGNRLPLASLAGLVALGGVIIGYSVTLPTLVVGTAIVGFASGLYTLLPAAIAVEFGASGVGRAFGALMLFLPLNAFAPALIAKAQESTGSYGPAMLGLGVICLVGGAAILLMREQRGGHPTPAKKDAALEEPITSFP